MRAYLIPFLLVAACGNPGNGDDSNEYMNNPDDPTADAFHGGDEPAHIEVDHILIGIRGPRLPVDRNEQQARELKDDIMARLAKGESWDELRNQYSDDPPQKGVARGGPYKLANNGQPADKLIQEYPRKGMVPAFGDVGFKLKVGKIAVAEYDSKTSPYGFHIIKRTR